MSELRKQEQDGLVYYTSPQLSLYSKLKHGFFTRKGGVSQPPYDSLNFRFSSRDSRENVEKNFDIAARALGSGAGHVARTTQRHTNEVRAVTQVDRLTAIGDGVDGLVTNTPGVVLCGFYADCQLVMLYDRKLKACGLAHAGWRGVVNQVVSKTIEAMTQHYGTNPNDLIVAVGPSICRSCFVTDDDVPQQLRESFGDMVQEYMFREGEKWCVDLKNITYAMLLRAGVPPYHIDISALCPCCGDKTLFWSHRRDGEERGVHGGMITLTE